MANFDEAVVAQSDGTTQRLNRDQFYQVPLPERVKLLWALKVQFYKNGRQVPASAALES
jgi:hypothetical protein